MPACAHSLTHSLPPSPATSCLLANLACPAHPTPPHPARPHSCQALLLRARQTASYTGLSQELATLWCVYFHTISFHLILTHNGSPSVPHCQYQWLNHPTTCLPSWFAHLPLKAASLSTLFFFGGGGGSRGEFQITYPPLLAPTSLSPPSGKMSPVYRAKPLGRGLELRVLSLPVHTGHSTSMRSVPIG